MIGVGAWGLSRYVVGRGMRCITYLVCVGKVFLRRAQGSVCALANGSLRRRDANSPADGSAQPSPIDGADLLRDGCFHAKAQRR